jgi:dTDP-L-rhamnose 4-epimerase
MKILVTGGAGFIGRHFCKLAARSHDVIVCDSFVPIVHRGRRNYEELNGCRVDALDVLETGALSESMSGCEVVVHLAADVSVGASHNEPTRFVHQNSCGAASVVQACARAGVRKLIAASSMSIYGEGGLDFVHESAVPRPESMYGVSKLCCEEIARAAGRCYGFDVVAARFFNVYGPGQALHNSETGVVPIFASRAMKGEPPIVFEDGHQTRDFVYVDDVANAIMRFATQSGTGVYNVCRGDPQEVGRVASLISRSLGGPPPILTHSRRHGDVRHCIGDPGQCLSVFGFRAETPPEDGLYATTEWCRKISRKV